MKLLLILSFFLLIGLSAAITPNLPLMPVDIEDGLWIYPAAAIPKFEKQVMDLSGIGDQLFEDAMFASDEGWVTSSHFVFGDQKQADYYGWWKKAAGWINQTEPTTVPFPTEAGDKGGYA